MMQMRSFGRALIIIFALLPLLTSAYATRASDGGLAPYRLVAEARAASSHGSHCSPSEQDGSGTCAAMLCCGITHSGCCPLLVIGIELPELAFAVPLSGAASAFNSLCKPPPLPPPIARLAS
jgi:hypothetical protein